MVVGVVELGLRWMRGVCVFQEAAGTIGAKMQH
jgi:hypothetical protein